MVAGRGHFTLKSDQRTHCIFYFWSSRKFHCLVYQSTVFHCLGSCPCKNFEHFIGPCYLRFGVHDSREVFCLKKTTHTVPLRVLLLHHNVTGWQSSRDLYHLETAVQRGVTSAQWTVTGGQWSVTSQPRWLIALTVASGRPVWRHMTLTMTQWPRRSAGHQENVFEAAWLERSLPVDE